MIVDIYRSSKKEGLYIFLESGISFDSVPEDLKKQFGTPVFSMKLELHAKRTLAQADVKDVMSAIAEKGFFLQMPPTIGASALVNANNLMPASKQS